MGTSAAGQQWARWQARRSQRGFTMAELLTVVAIIGILAAAAAPVFKGLLQESRVTAGAQQAADLYRRARMRAMGRGAATMVRWNGAAVYPSAKHLTMWEAVVGVGTGAAQKLPSSRCVGNNWAANSPTSRRIDAVDVRSPEFGPASAYFQITYLGAVLNFFEICFTPRGRTFWRHIPNAAWNQLVTSPRLVVKNTTSNRTRYVVIPPTGAARVVSKVQ